MAPSEASVCVIGGAEVAAADAAAEGADVLLVDHESNDILDAWTACDTDGNGELDMQELVARYGRQAGHMLKEFDLDEGNTISKDEFVAVLAAKCQVEYFMEQIYQCYLS